MGGVGSGSWYRWNSKTVVEDGLTLDLCRLIRNKLVAPGFHVSNSVIWTKVSNGEKVASIGCESNLMNPDTAWVRLHYTTNGKPMDYRVNLTTTNPHYGGLRWWFICPANGSRVAKLYSPNGGDIFASRKAYNLAYQSQHETTMFRHLTTAQDIRHKLGGSTCTDDPFPEKPKGMHWKTYYGLRRKSELAMQSSNLAAAKIFGFCV